MQLTEFAEIMAFLEATSGKSPPKGAVKAYYECLKDLPLDVLQTAAKRVVMEHVWATFPSVAELRQAASETARGVINELSPAEAWGIVMRTMAKLDVAFDESHQAQILSAIPALAMQAAQAFGLMALYNLPDANLETARAQFRTIYEQLAARDRRTALLPDSLKRGIAEIGRKTLPPPNILKIPEIGRILDTPASSVACQPRADAPINFRTVAQKQTQVLEQERLAEDAAWDRCLPERKSELFARLASQHPGAAQRPEMLDRPCRRLALEDERKAAKAAG
jgi:hypothetical protein